LLTDNKIFGGQAFIEIMPSAVDYIEMWQLFVVNKFKQDICMILNITTMIVRSSLYLIINPF